jgi:hypothetical protein
MRIREHLAWLVPTLLAACLLFSLKSPVRTGADLQGFGRLPILHGGRVKPIDTIARSSLLMLQGRQTLGAGTRSLEAVEWLLDVLARPEAADVNRIFAIEEPELLGLMGKERGREKYLSFMEISPFLAEIEAQASRASSLEAARRSRFQAAVLNLQERLELYWRLKNTLQIEGTVDLPGELKEYVLSLPAGIKALKSHQGASSYDRKALEALSPYFQRYRFLVQAASFRPLPPLSGEAPEGWNAMGEALLGLMRGGGDSHPGIEAYAGILRAWRRKEPAVFGRALLDYERWLGSAAPRGAAWARREAFFNRAEPFYKGMVLYLAAFLLALASWILWPRVLETCAFRVMLLAFLVHTAGLFARVVIQGRPPVTNL